MTPRYLLFANRSHALRHQRRASVSSGETVGRRHGQISGMLGTVYTTPWGFVREMWDLAGDGRQLADASFRVATIYSLLADFNFNISVSTARMIARLASAFASSVADFPTGGLSDAERSVISLILRYLDEASARGFVEAADIIDDVAAISKDFSVEFAERCIIEAPLDRLFPFDGSEEAQPEGGNEPGVPIKILKSAGASVTYKMISDEIESLAGLAQTPPASIPQEGLSPTAPKSIVLATANPIAAYRALRPIFQKCARRASLKDTIAVSRTCIGRTLLSYIEILRVSSGLALAARDAYIVDATDFLASPYAGIYRPANSPGDSVATDFNTKFRSDRTLTEADAIDSIKEVAANSEIFDALSGHCGQDCDLPSCERELRKWAYASFAGLDLEIELRAVHAVVDLAQALTDAGLDLLHAPDFIPALSVSIEVRERYGDAASPISDILILPLGRASELSRGSFDYSILDDATDAYLNAREDRSAISILAEKLGRPLPRHALERARERFTCAYRAAREGFICTFPMRDQNFDETYTSFAFDELISGMGSAKGDIEERSLGEEYVVGGIGRQFLPADSMQVLPCVSRGQLTHTPLLDFMVKHDEAGRVLPVISPSAIEAYMACPYRWFFERKLRVNGFDEDFGPMEAGNMAHAVLERFYRQMKSIDDIARSARDLADAGSLFGEVFDSVLEEQKQKNPASGRYIPISALEQNECARFRARLGRFLDAMDRLPANYSPAVFEYKITPHRGGIPVEYAGAFINGTVDRYDVNDADGRFYVLDYKGSIRNHSAGSATFDFSNSKVYPRHVQTLVYASLLKRIFHRMGHEMDCVGAFYISYRTYPQDGKVSGSFDMSVPALSDIADRKSMVVGDFEDFLDNVEDMIGEHLKRLFAGNIEIMPHTKDTCDYCGYFDCAMRGRG